MAGVAEAPFYDEPESMLLCPYPGWYMWRGVAGLVYARRERSSPPVVFRAGGERAEQDVLDKIEAWYDDHPNARSATPVRLAQPWETPERS